MIQNNLILAVFVLTFSSCQKEKVSVSSLSSNETAKWNFETLKEKSIDHLDSNKRDYKLFKQDIDTYHKYAEIFKSYPLNKSPFPVAEYDYAVSNVPFSFESGNFNFKGIRIGECLDPDCQKVATKLTLMISDKDRKAEETTLVDSRNSPYLTAQGTFQLEENKYDWVFSASPDGFSTLILNMKLFDLRFGETIIIYPQEDNSFFYNQLNDSPDNYEKLEGFEKSILSKLEN